MTSMDRNMTDTSQITTSYCAAALTVLYDGSCPLCRREIAVYRELQPLQPGSPVSFADISNAAVPLPAGTTREQLLARFHVQGPDGQLFSGAQAFLALWAALPGWRWLALAGRLPGASWVMERMYRLFLRWRPLFQRWARAADRSSRCDEYTDEERERLTMRR
jgi:predicted DCC family thiol-disulfide oxidoreductase YuxK